MNLTIILRLISVRNNQARKSAKMLWFNKCYQKFFEIRVNCSKYMCLNSWEWRLVFHPLPHPTDSSYNDRPQFAPVRLFPRSLHIWRPYRFQLAETSRKSSLVHVGGNLVNPTSSDRRPGAVMEIQQLGTSPSRQVFDKICFTWKTVDRSSVRNRSRVQEVWLFFQFFLLS